VAPSQVLYERMSADHDARRPVGLQSAHRPQAGRQSAVIAFTSIVLILPGVVKSRRDQVRGHVRQGRSSVRDDLRRGAMRGQDCGEEAER